MARTTAEVLEQVLRWLPEHYQASSDVLGGMAAQIAHVEGVLDEMVDDVTVGGAEGVWLTLLARGYGVVKTDGEADAELRSRLRNVEDKLTVQAIEDAVDTLLATYTAETCEIVEHWAAENFADVDAWADQSYLFTQHNAFTLICPQVGTWPTGTDYADQAYVESAWAGTGAWHEVYTAIAVEVERLRAGGVRWWLLVDNT